MAERIFTDYFLINCEPDDVSLLMDVFEKYEVEVLESTTDTLLLADQYGDYAIRDRQILTIKTPIPSVWSELNRIHDRKEFGFEPLFIN